MLGGVLSLRPKPWLLTSLTFSHCSAPHKRTETSPIKLIKSNNEECGRRYHSTACQRRCKRIGAASIWHSILPARRVKRPALSCFHHDQKGEGSWNVACDVRPARWLHRPDSAWLLFGVCACHAAPLETVEKILEPNMTNDCQNKNDSAETLSLATDSGNSNGYKVKGVPADGRCLFRALAHMNCLRNGEEAPNEDRQRELADKLRAQVVDELVSRRKEIEWIVEEDFDTYVERIRQPFVWGGEPELLMASHILKTVISVFMLDKSSGNLLNIANYGEEYKKDDEVPLKVLFHGYGHYDILEAVKHQSCLEQEA